MKLQTMCAGLALALAACQNADGDVGGTKADATKATLTGEACPDVGEKAYFFWMEARSAEPGDKIAMFPYWTDMPGAYNDLPPGCLDNLGVSPEGAATFIRQEDGLPIAEVSADVEAGTRIRLEATYNGHSLSGPVEVFRAADNPLVGTWRQDGEGCPEESAIRELVFTGGGDFSVTWTPFEVYKYYWGSYSYDPETGAIALDVEGGNQIPEDIVPEGTVTADETGLHFETLSFGTPGQATGACDGDFPK
ncbi:hypothetical protein [Hyphomonas sp.]|uniref:hypothetical protein n=1 Tax=Hyphomonas sp. TaxID=87 RepID=UPI003527BC30